MVHLDTYAATGGHRNLYRVAAARDDVLEVQRPMDRGSAVELRLDVGGRGGRRHRRRGRFGLALDVQGLRVDRHLHRARPVRVHGTILVVEAFELKLC